MQSICQLIWKTQQWPQDWKRSVFIPIAKKGSAKECSNYCTIVLISHACKVILKILQVRFQQYLNRELPDVQDGRLRNQKSNCQHPLDHRKSKRVSEKHLLLLHWLCQSLWLCGSQQTVENSYLKRWEYQTTLLPSWEICMQVKKQQLEPDGLVQRTGSKSGKEYVKAVYYHLVYLTYMQSTSCEMLGWMNHKLESRLLREISDIQMIAL